MSRILLFLMAAVTFSHCLLPYGPCRKFTAVELDVNKWSGEMYINVESIKRGERCQWATRHINKRGDKVLIWEQFQHIENGTEEVKYSVEGEYVEKGHYKFSKVLSGKEIIFHAYFLHFDPPQLDIHFVCSDDPLFKDGKGALVCESQYPDAPKYNAAIIKKVLTNNGIDLRSLMMTDNCKCTNIPYHQGPSKCSNTTVNEYFGI